MSNFQSNTDNEQENNQSEELYLTNNEDHCATEQVDVLQHSNNDRTLFNLGSTVRELQNKTCKFT